MSRGTCPKCKKNRWLGGKGKVCKPCGYSLGTCRRCQSKRKLCVDNLCYVCYQDRQVRAQLDQIETNFIPITQYNRHIFDLYLVYIRRYGLQYFHLKQARKLKSLLEEQACPIFKTWLQIYKWSEKWPLPHKKGRASGDATIKIACILQELGVLPPKSEELGRQKLNLIKAFTKNEQKWINPFICYLEKTNRASDTVLKYLVSIRDFNIWLKSSFPEANIILANVTMIQNYLDHCLQAERKTRYIRDVYNVLNSFYRWARFEHLILMNPCEPIQVRREAQRLQVCSEEDLEKLYAFIKSPESCPEQAMLLALILFYGLKIEDFRFAKVEIFSDQMTCILRRKDLTKGKTYYNRKEYLRLPSKPKWFLNLQRRYYVKWQRHYQKVKKNYPQYWLLLPYHLHYNRPLGQDCVRIRINKASIAATGVAIHPKVLRQTCGHIYSRNQDASILATLGWSPQFAFHYTWLPRQYFTGSK